MTKKGGFRGQISNIDLRTLRIYKTIVECRGFSAAEVELNISRAAISIAMSDLEARIGLRLCQRGRSGFSLTDEGAQVYELTLQVISALEEFRTQVNMLHAQLKGTLNIGITDNLVTMSHMRITNALAQLKERGSEVKINIRMAPPNEIELGVLDGRLHVGMVPDLRPMTGLDYLPLYEETLLLYCSDNHALFTLADSDLTQAVIEEQDAVVPTYAQRPNIKTLHQKLKASATATDREGVAFLVLTGRYIGYLPDHFAKQWEREGKLRALLPERYRYNTIFSVITRKDSRANRVLETFLDELKKIP